MEETSTVRDHDEYILVSSGVLLNSPALRVRQVQGAELLDFNEVTLVVARDKFIMDLSLWCDFKVALLLSGFQYTGRADAHN